MRYNVVIQHSDKRANGESRMDRPERSFALARLDVIGQKYVNRARLLLKEFVRESVPFER